MIAYTRFELLRFIRRPQVFLITVSFPAGMYWMSSSARSEPIAGMAGNSYFLGSMLAWAVILTSTVPAGAIAGERASGWAQQLRVTPMPARAYVVGKFTVGVLFVAAAVGLVAALGVATDGVAAIRWPLLVLVMTMAAIPLVGVGVAVGHVVNESSSRPVLMVCTFGLAGFGGLWWPVTQFPSWLQAPAKALPSYQLATIARSIAGGRLPWFGNVAVIAVWILLLAGLIAWRFRRDETNAGPAR